MSRRLAFSLVAVASLLATAPAHSQSPGLVARPSGVDDAAGSIELVDPKVLRVCADPSNLPFSNSAGEGFENKLAAFLAKKLGKDLAYSYYPGATGFIRNTLNAHLCDVVMGMPQGDDLVQPTNPYYRTSYAVVYRAGSDLEGLELARRSAPRQGQAHRPRRQHAARQSSGSLSAARGGEALSAGRRHARRRAGRRYDPRSRERRDRRRYSLGADSPAIMRKSPAAG